MKDKQNSSKTRDEKLSLKQMLFCQAYVDTYGNSTEAVLRAGYNISKKNGNPDRNLAKSIGSENLLKPDILAYINKLLEKAGLNDEGVAIQHRFLIDQFSDLSVKARAIDIYYKLKGNYSTKKYEISAQGTFNINDQTLRRIMGIEPSQRC